MFPAFSQTYQELSERAVAATEQDSLSLAEKYIDLLAVLQVEGDAALAVHGLHQIFVDIVPVLVIVFKEVLEIALLVDHQAVDAVGAQKLRRRLDARRVHIKM